MRKGFSATLATVAFAMLGLRAMALAPTISEIPDVIVGDAEDTSAANIFVYPEVFNLDTKVTDDETTAGGIIWSYWEAGTPVYRINDTDPVPDPGDMNNIVNPPSSQRIELNLDPADGDADPRTITIRDILRSPLPAQASYPDPAGGVTPPDTVILPESRVITLFASDGSTVSLDNARSFIVYSDDNGLDRLSGEAADLVIPDPGLWTGVNELASIPAGNATLSQPGGSACFTVPVPPAGGDLTKANLYRYYSPYGIVELSPNTVYEARLTVSTSQTTVGETPAFSWLWDNIAADGSFGRNEYGGEFVFLDNVGGANSPISGVGRSEFVVYMFPTQGKTPQFLDGTNGFFRADNIDHAHMRLNFRLLDVGNGGYGAEFDNGTVCLDHVEIFSHSLASMSVESTVYNVSNIAPNNPLTADSWSVTALGEPTTVDFSGGNVTISPTTSWDDPTIIDVTPGDTTADITGGTDLADNWPIAWESDGLYYVEFMLNAPTVTDEANPPDVIQIGADAPTSELTMFNFAVYQTQDPTLAVPNRGVSMPRAGSSQPYVAFFTTHTVTSDSAGPRAIWRPRMQILNTPLLSAWGRVTNTGGVTVDSVRVQKVSF